MGRDTTYNGTLSELTGLTKYVSSISIAESAAAALVLKVRDSIGLATAPSAVDAAAGNVTVGLHNLAVTWVTRWGESVVGTRGEFTAAGSKIATVTVPVGPGRGVNTATFPAIRDTIVGRRVYATKAAAPATGIPPTNAQWFLLAADVTTTQHATMANIPLYGMSSITVADASAFASAGNALITTSTGVIPISYTSTDGTHLIGCTVLSTPQAASGTMTSGAAVSQPMIPDNTTTTYSWNLADGNLVNTRPATIDTAGRILRHFKILTSTSHGSQYGANVLALENNGGAYVEITSGAALWAISGR